VFNVPLNSTGTAIKLDNWNTTSNIVDIEVHVGLPSSSSTPGTPEISCPSPCWTPIDTSRSAAPPAPPPPPPPPKDTKCSGIMKAWYRFLGFC